MEQSAVQKSRRLFELPTFQRRLRHLRSVAIRNLVCLKYSGKDVSKLQSYFTLHKDSQAKAFYTSEKITGSLNPTWQSFDISRYEGEINIKSQSLVVRVWVAVDTQTRLLIDWQVHLKGLCFFADKLQQDSVKKHTANTVIFGMFDKFFVAPDVGAASKTDALSLLLDGVTPKTSYTASSLQRIHMVLRAIKQTQLSVSKVHRSIKDKLLSSQETTQKLSSREALLLKVGQLRNELTWKSSKLQTDHDEYEKICDKNNKSKHYMEGKFSLLDKERSNLSDRRKAYNQTRESLIKENAQLWIRRKQLLGELVSNIYPIKENKKHEMSICDVKLPNSENFQGQDETMIAVALGCTCHMVSMMSDILDIPLRYPMEHRGSRSMIRDHIHTKLADKDREFPLYSKGKERFQFNYGVFLLNKNISQLRFFCGMGTTDLRTTLLNIRSLLESKLGFKTDNTTLMPVTPGSNGRERSLDFDKTDTQSSLASGGRFSLPDSNDMAAFEASLKENRNTEGRRDFDNSSDNSITDFSNRRNEIDDSEDIFHPSNDNFFKISNPVSEQLEMLGDFNVIQEDVGSLNVGNQDQEISENQATDFSSAIVQNKFETFSSQNSDNSNRNMAHSRLQNEDVSSEDLDRSLNKQFSAEDNNKAIVLDNDTNQTSSYCAEQMTPDNNINTYFENESVIEDEKGSNSNFPASKVVTHSVQDGANLSNSETTSQHIPISNEALSEEGIVDSKKSSYESDSSMHYPSFKTAAFKHKEGSPVYSDTKSFESFENVSSDNGTKAEY